MTLFLFPTLFALLHAMQPDKEFNNNGSQDNTNRDTVLRVTAEEKEANSDESDVSTFYRPSFRPISENLAGSRTVGTTATVTGGPYSTARSPISKLHFGESGDYNKSTMIHEVGVKTATVTGDPYSTASVTHSSYGTTATVTGDPYSTASVTHSSYTGNTVDIGSVNTLFPSTFGDRRRKGFRLHTEGSTLQIPDDTHDHHHTDDYDDGDDESDGHRTKARKVGFLQSVKNFKHRVAQSLVGQSLAKGASRKGARV